MLIQLHACYRTCSNTANSRLPDTCTYRSLRHSGEGVLVDTYLLRHTNDNLAQMFSLPQILDRVLRLLKRKNSIDVRLDFVRPDEAEHVVKQLFRADIDPTM